MTLSTSYVRAIAFFSLLAVFAVPLHAQNPDIAVSKSGPAVAAAGSNVPYTITVMNVGDGPSGLVTLSDPIPPGMSFVSAAQNSGPVFSCTTPAVGDVGTITCTIDPLNAGETATFTFTMQITADTDSGATVTNIATVSDGSGTDPNDENNSSTAVTTTPQPSLADMAVTKTGPDRAAAGTDVTYTIAVMNNGPNDAASVQVDDTLPGTMTFVSLVQTSGPTMNCSTGQTISCTAATFPAGATATLSLTAHLPSDTPPYTQFTNTASVTSFNDQTEENNVSGTTLTTSAVDLSVTKSAPATAAAGSPLQYTISVANLGPDAAANVQLADILPPGTTFVSLNQNTGPAGSCATPLAGSSGTVACGWAGLAVNATATFTLTVTPGDVAVVTNTASISSDSFDTNASNDSSSASTTITPVADLGVTKSGPASATAGTNVTYSIGVTNAGPSTATSVSLSDPLPTGATFVSLAQTTGPVFNCTTPAAGAGGTVTCTAASLAPSGAATFSLVVRMASATTGLVSNTASITSAVSDANATNNSATATTSVTASANLSISKTAPPLSGAGGTVTWTIVVDNAGPSDATNVTMSDTVPASSTFASINQTAGPTFVCTPPGTPTGTLTCTIASLTAGSSATFSFVTNTNVGASGSISNTATVTAASADPVPGNNTATASTTISQAADVSVTKSGPATATSGANVTYTITVTNSGPAVATGVSVGDTLPPNTTFVSLSQTSGPNFTCTTPAVGAASTVTCTSATLASGASAAFSLVININPAATGTLSNTTTVSTTTLDPNAANNTSQTSTALSLQPVDLSLTKTANSTTFVSGSLAVFTLTATNNSVPTAFGVVITDPLPAGATLSSYTASQGTCSGTTTVTCSLGDLAGGATATLTLRVTLPSTPGNSSNTATISAANADPTPGNNSGAAAFAIVGAGGAPTLSPVALAVLAAMLAAIALFKRI